MKLPRNTYACVRLQVRSPLIFSESDTREARPNLATTLLLLVLASCFSVMNAWLCSSLLAASVLKSK